MSKQYSDNDDVNEASVISVKTEVMTLSQGLLTLGANIAVGASADDVLNAKCLNLEQERDDFRSLIVESDKPLVSARREALGTVMSVKLQHDMTANSSLNQNVHIC